MSDADKKFREQLAKMDRSVLNSLRIQDYPQTQRRLINDERVRRKEDESNTSVTALATLLGTLAVQTNETTRNNSVRQHQSNGSGIGNFRLPSAYHSRSSTNAGGGSSRKTENEPECWYLFEDYHDRVSEEVDNVVFIANTESYDRAGRTNLTGRFKCSNQTCGKGWSSNIVATVILGFDRGGGKLGYCAQVYNQRCKRCEELGIMDLDEDIYIERVARRLKIWRGEFVPDRREGRKDTPPHEEDLCEGCKAGICQRARFY
ncbi:hypothetical protein TWF281_004819 [Arthrobotrys megalospora]